jgi:hypothetical protein
LRTAVSRDRNAILHCNRDVVGSTPTLSEFFAYFFAITFEIDSLARRFSRNVLEEATGFDGGCGIKTFKVGDFLNLIIQIIENLRDI